MNEILLSSHSWLRWIVLLLFIAVIARSFSGYRSGRIYDALDKRWNTLLLASVHTQALLGLILYFTSDMMRNIFADFGGSIKNSDSRFWSVEHITIMLISVILTQVGSIRVRKQIDDRSKFRTAYIYYGIALLLILLMIPWGIWNAERPLFRM
ncbi:MAG: cytochrome b [Saprospiraceae bacterium]